MVLPLRYFFPDAGPIRKQVIILLLLLSCCIPAQGQSNGRIFISNYSILDYGAGSQNWDIVQGTDGLMYFGNNEGVLQYDGVHWSVIPVANNSTVRSLALDSTGLLYVGAEGDLGLLEPDDYGKLRFHSLLPMLDSTLTGESVRVSQVWSTHASRSGIYFRGGDALYRWHQGRMEVIDADTRFGRSFLLGDWQTGDSLYVQQQQMGLMRVEGSTLSMVPGGELYADDRIYTMLPYPGGRFLIVSTQRGLHVFNPKALAEADRFAAMPSAIPDYFDIATNRVYNAIALPNRLYAFASLGKGVLVIDEAGGLVKHLAKDSGLAIDMAICLFLDRQMGLWVGLDGGISRCELYSPWNFWPKGQGLNSDVTALTHFNGSLYLASGQGLLRATPSEFLSVGNLEGQQVWDLLEFKNPRRPGEGHLLAASSNGIFQMDADLSSPLLTKPTLGLRLHQKRGDPFIVYAGLARGMMAFRFEEGAWVDIGSFEQIDSDVVSIAEDRQHNLWVTTADQEVYCMKFSKPNDAFPIETIVYDDSKGVVPSNYFEVFYLNGRIMLGTDHGLLEYHQDRDVFEPSTALGSAFAMGRAGVKTVVPAQGDEVWVASLNTIQGSIGRVDMGSGELEQRDFLRLPPMEILNLYNMGDTVLWVAGEHLYRYSLAAAAALKPDTSFTAMVRQVTANGDSVVFGGNFFRNIDADTLRRLAWTQPANMRIILPFEQNTLEFQYSSTQLEEPSGTLYSYFLEGHDRGWSPWSPDTKQRFTDLSHGTYTFRVRARNIYGQESQEGAFTFTLSPPIYRTFGAYILYFVLLVGLMGFVATAYSRMSQAKLQAEKRKLEMLVAERTEEVEAQKALLEKKNKDTVSSINYAKRILNALHTSHEQLGGYFPESFFFFKPRDIVSGDFFWMQEADGKLIIAVVDCTGHGIPGAFMSVIGNAILKEIVSFYRTREPHDILEALHQMVQEHLHQEETDNKDGMDIALCVLDFKHRVLHFAGARNPLVYVRQGGGAEMLKGNRRSVGGTEEGGDKTFTKQTLALEPGMMCYMYSDGFQDQFGSKAHGGRKYTSGRFRRFLDGIASLPADEQRLSLERELADWQGNSPQIDDIMVVGFKVPPLD
jgi:serine phosphatase RsbU (regulator of sigma subunit)/ligand-binding sensor domain-containing protein